MFVVVVVVVCSIVAKCCPVVVVVVVVLVKGRLSAPPVFEERVLGEDVVSAVGVLPPCW